MAKEKIASFNDFYSDPLLSLASISARARAGQATSLRSIYWRHFFDLLPTPSPSYSNESARYQVNTARRQYDDLIKKFIIQPAGDPLSLNASSSWQRHFDTEEVRKVIQMDVERAFPEMEFFRDEIVQQRMTEILFIYTQLKNPYRQGMHELLGLIYYTVHQDSLEPINDSQPEFILSSLSVSNDSFSIFLALMKSGCSYYDSNSSIPIPLAQNSTTLIQPVVAQSIAIYQTLHKIDPILHQKLVELEIEPQLFLIRFLRLLFSREIPFFDVLVLWDGIFSFGDSLRIVDYVAIAMLLRIRASILESDYSSALNLLLRYPAPSDLDWRIPLLIKQGAYLRDNSTIEAGRVCEEQNIKFGAIAGEVTSYAEAQEKESPRSDMMKTTGSHGTVTAAYLLSEGAGLVSGVFETFNEIRRGVHAQQYRERLSSPTSFSRPPIPASLIQPPSPPSNVQDRVPNLPSLAHVKEIESLLEANQAIQEKSLQLSEAIALAVRVLEREWITKSEDTKPSTERDSKILNSFTLLRHITEVLQSSSPKSTLNPALLAQLLPPPSTPAPVNPATAKSVQPKLSLSNRYEPPPSSTLTRTSLPSRNPIPSPLPRLNQISRPPPSPFDSPRQSQTSIRNPPLVKKDPAPIGIKPTPPVPKQNRIISPNSNYFPPTSFATRSVIGKKEVRDPLGALG